MMKLRACLAVAALTLACFPASAQSRCPAGESGCTTDNAASKIQERTREGARNVMRNENPRGRAREVYETARDCVNCGMDAVRDKAQRMERDVRGVAQ